MILHYHIDHFRFFELFIARLKLAHRRTDSETGRGGLTASAPVELEYVPGEQGSHADAPVKGERNRCFKYQFIANARNLEKNPNKG